MKFKNIATTLFFIIFCITTMLGCKKELEAIIIEGGDFSLQVGQTKTLKLIPKPEKAVLEGALFASSSPAIAKVSTEGVVTAIKGGKTKITAVASGKMASCTVTVKTNVAIAQGDLILSIGDTKQLSLEPEELNDENVTYSSSDSEIVEVMQNGLIKAKSEGTATITASVNDETCSITVQVVKAATLQFVSPITQIELGHQEKLQVQSFPENLTNIFSSSNPNILEISQDGTITAKKVGSSIISVISQETGKSASTRIEVVNQYSPLTIQQDDLIFQRVAYEDFDDATLNGTTEGGDFKIEDNQFQYLTTGNERKFQLNCTQDYDFVRIRLKVNAAQVMPFNILLTSGADIVYLRESDGTIHCKLFDAATWASQSALVPLTNYTENSKTQFVNFDIYRTGENDVTIYVDGVAYPVSFSGFTAPKFTSNPVFKFAKGTNGITNTHSLVEYVACYKGPTINQNNFTIIPEPVSITMKAGDFTISSSTVINNKSGLPLSPQINIFKEQIKTSSGILLQEGESQTNYINLVKTNENKNSEWYKLEVTQSGINITAKTKSGFFYAFQTLLQMLPPEVFSKTQKNFSLAIACATIEDQPRFPHRGLHTDVSRHFFPISTLKTIIDEIAKTKINKFHWHLTDDGGFRFPFEGTVTVGSKVYDLNAFVKKTTYRTGTTPESSNFQFSWNFFDPTDTSDPWYAYKDNMHGGCYTKEEIIDFISYCDDRCITIIPEIDLPGHSRPLHIFFEDLRCDKVNTNSNDKNVTNDICAASEATLPILKELIRQMCEVFPSEVFNIGGDEVHINNKSWYPLGPWWFCSKCEAKIKEVVGASAAVTYPNLQKLQAYVTKELEKAVIANGKRCAIWNEAMRGNFQADPSTILWYWNGPNDLNSSLAQGMEIVNCDTWNYYIDYYQHQSDRNSKNPDAQDWGGSAPTITLESIYKNDPTKEHSGISFGNKQIGVQVNMWCEKIIGFTKNGKTYSKDEHLIYMIFPRVFALSESAWTLASKKNYDKFYNKMQTHFKRLDNAGLDCYATHYKK